MGNPSWGKGYHTGFNDGAKTVGIIGSVLTLVAIGTVWGYNKIKMLRVRKQEKNISVTEGFPAEEEQGDNENNS